MSGKIENLHTAIFNLVGTVTGFNQGFYEQPKSIDQEKLPAYCVYLESVDNSITTSATNRREYTFAVEVIYDKEDMDTTQTVVSDLISEVIGVLEDKDNYSLSGNAHFTLPAKVERIEDYRIAGKHYLAYKITIQAVSNELI